LPIVSVTFDSIHLNLLGHPYYYATLDTTPLRRYPYFDARVWLAWSNDPDSYAGGSVGPPVPDSSKAITQNKMDTPVIQVGDWAWCRLPRSMKYMFY